MDELITELIARFQEAPHGFFHERELHAVFYAVCRDALGMAVTVHEGQNAEVHLLRYEYDSLWKYRRDEPERFGERYADEGTTACFDFAVLNPEFVAQHNLLTVINKFDALRADVRNNQPQVGCSTMVDAAIEFKMAHRRQHADVMNAAITSLHNGMVCDARKLAKERVAVGYLLGFSHGPLPMPGQAQEIVQACVNEHQNHLAAGVPAQIRVLIATPDDIIHDDNWANGA